MTAPLPQEPSLRELRLYLEHILDELRDIRQQLNDTHKMMITTIDLTKQMNADISVCHRAIDKDL